MTSPTAVLRCVKAWLEDLLFPWRMQFGRKIMYDDQRQIVQVSATEVIKGPCSVQEFEALRFVAAHTSVHVPHVHRTYQRRTGLYIAMDFVHGERLDLVWPQLDDEGQRKFVRLVCEQVKLLRRIHVPETLGLAVASVEGGEIKDGIFGPKPIGPFADLNAFKLCLSTSPNLGVYCGLWDKAQDGVQSVLTHADIAPRNVIVRESDKAVFIIDWELAGWWPEYWEQIKWHFSDFPPLPNWTKLMDEMLGTVQCESRESAKPRRNPNSTPHERLH